MALGHAKGMYINNYAPMTYNPIKKIILVLIIFMSIAGSSFAQNNAQAMRFLTVTALMRYGQNLYERGDYDGASAVFTHVLSYDKNQAKVLQFLKEMGHSPVAVFIPVPTLAPIPKIIWHTENKIVMKKTDVEIIKKVDVEDTESLREAIAAKKQIIEKLQAEIFKMKANLPQAEN